MMHDAMRERRGGFAVADIVKTGFRDFDVRAQLRFDITRLVPLLEAAHERLGGVYIECLPWRAFIERYDRPHTLFFLDPPYYGTEDYYGPLFDRSQFEVMSEVLRGIQGRFIMTLNDHPEMRRIFGWAEMQAAEINYTVSGQATKAHEVIIRSQV